MKKKNSSVKNFFLMLVVIAVIILAALIAIKILEKNSSEEVLNGEVVNLNQLGGNKVAPEAIKTVQIYKGNDRAVAVMIDNHDNARPQASINKAYVVYEIIVEGGYTRMMPIFKGQDIEQIGPVRSARHYFLDYALENDAIYVHFGQSPQAGSDIKSLAVDDIEGIYYSTNDFKRVSGKYAPHNVMVSTDKILRIAEEKDYRVTSDKKSVLNYKADEVELKNAESAKEVYIPFSTSQNVKFEYDKQNKVYTKYANSKKQVDWVTKEDVTFKNIIITYIENYTLDDTENKGRQGLLNIGEKNGYYITNGEAIKITCTKSTRASKTVYKDLDGNEIDVNDGNTYIGICPLNAKVLITPEEENVETVTPNNNTTNV